VSGQPALLARMSLAKALKVTLISDTI